MSQITANQWQKTTLLGGTIWAVQIFDFEKLDSWSNYSAACELTGRDILQNRRAKNKSEQHICFYTVIYASSDMHLA